MNRPRRAPKNPTGPSITYAESADIVQSIRADPNKRISRDQGTQAVRDFFTHGELSVEYKQVSLVCPNLKKRIVDPVRGVKCTHLECFDLGAYLQSQVENPTWLCPVCKRRTEAHDLRIDEYASHVLQMELDNVRSIEVFGDGSYRRVDHNANVVDPPVVLTIDDETGGLAARGKRRDEQLVVVPLKSLQDLDRQAKDLRRQLPERKGSKKSKTVDPADVAEALHDSTNAGGTASEIPSRIVRPAPKRSSGYDLGAKLVQNGFTALAEWVAKDLDAKRDAPLLRLLLGYALAKSSQLSDGTHHLVYIPAYLYNILPRNQQKYWVHNVVVPRSFQACIDSVKTSGLGGCAEGLAVAHTILSRLSVEDAELRSILCEIGCENTFSFAAQSFLVSGDYENALRVIAKFMKLSESPKELASLRLQQLQAFVATKDLPAAFRLAAGFLKEFSEPDVTSTTPLPIHPAENDAYQLVHQGNLPTYVALLLFHTFWCGNVKHFDSADSSALLLDSLILTSQAVWEDVGYALWQQLLEHIKAKELFAGQVFLKYVNNTALIADLCALRNTQISVVGSDKPMRGTELAKGLRSGKLKLSAESPRKLLFKFIDVYGERLTQLLSK